MRMIDYWSLSTLESGRQSDECESCLSQTRHETYTSVTLGTVGIIIVLVVSIVFSHFSSNPSPPGIKTASKDFSPMGVALLGLLLRTMSAPAQYVQDNGSKLGTHFCGLLRWMSSLVQNIEWISWICARQWHTSSKLSRYFCRLVQLALWKCSVVQNI